MTRLRILSLTLAVCISAAAESPKKKAAEPSALDKYVREATSEAPSGSVSSPGSMWAANSRLTDLSTDIRASQVNDIVTILVNEQASAVATGDVNTSRASSASSAITSLAGVQSPTGALANLLNMTSNTQLQGKGETSRGTQLTTTLSARVTHVLPNGYLVLEGAKDVQINSEKQTVTVRGVVRPIDLTSSNIVIRINWRN